MGYLFLPSRCMLAGSVALWATWGTCFMPKFRHMNAFKCMCGMCCAAPASTHDAGSTVSFWAVSCCRSLKG